FGIPIPNVARRAFQALPASLRYPAAKPASEPFMTLYRADPEDGVAWITGASTGLGRQLALDLAGEGFVVAATARDGERLLTLVKEAAGAPGRIVPYFCDVTDEHGMERTVAAIEKELGPV